MADNVSITAGSGETIAADDIGGAKYQRVKVTLGADGAADTDLDSGQQTSANSVPVVLASDQDILDGSRSATGTDAAAVSVGTTATAIIAANSDRMHLSVANNGGARIYLGSDSSVTAGQTGNNFGYLDPGDSWETAVYLGGVWGRTSSDTGYAVTLEVD